MTKVQFFSQSARDSDNIAANTARLLNLYPEPILTGGKSAYMLKAVPAMQPFSALPGVFCRALATINNKFYAVAGGRLLEIGASGSYTDLGAIDPDENTSIAGNNGDVTIVANGKYYRWNGTTLNNPTAGAFSSFGSHDYISNYTVLTELNGRRFQWSDIANANSLPGLNFSTADGRDDLIIRPFTINGVLYIFKQTSHEVWYVTGQSGANAFERQAGGVQDIGLKAHNLIAKMPGSAFFVGSDGRAHIVSGGIQPVSTPPVETAIKTCTPQSCFVYEDEGHTFCVITFKDCPAWVYDVATGMWHERGEGSDIGPWTAACSAKYSGNWYVGTATSDVAKLTAYPLDNNQPFICEATSGTMYQDGQRFTISAVELFPRQGFTSGTIELQTSKDSGLTWTVPKPRQIGPVGAYGQRITWRALGQFRQATAKVRVNGIAGFSMLADGALS